MSTNRIAIYGHRGWASSTIVAALAKCDAISKILYRPGSDVSSIPTNVTTVEVDVEDQAILIAALQDIDILISLVGHEGVLRQRDLIRAIPSTSVKLFVPSDLAFRCETLGLRIPINKNKREIELMARQAEIPTTIVLPGCLVEPSLSTTMLGVDVTRNILLYMGQSEHQRINMCTIEYVAAAYASIFTSTPLSELQNKVIGLCEMQISGSEIASALEQKHKKCPEIRSQSLDRIDGEIKVCLEKGDSLALAWYCRRVWASGEHVGLVGTNTFEVPGYDKSTIDELLVDGKLSPYRQLPPSVTSRFDAMQEMSAPS